MKTELDKSSKLSSPTCPMILFSLSGSLRGMNQINEQMLFEDSLCARVKKLRENRGWTAEQMAIALGVPPDRYRKYENRSPIPQYLIPRFAAIVDQSIEFVLTGHQRKPNLQPVRKLETRQA